MTSPFTVTTPTGNRLRCYQSGPPDGQPILALHGLTATHRYVVMGSTFLQRKGFRFIHYDARGHGESSPAPIRTAYSYDDLVSDAIAVLDTLAIPAAVIIGSSMGAHTAVAMAQQHQQRVQALALITPAYDPTGSITATPQSVWQALANGLRDDGVEGFLAAFPFAALTDKWRSTARKAVEQRLRYHQDIASVADAIAVVSQSQPFTSFDLPEVPTLIIASRDEADPFHPLCLAQQYQQAIPGSTLLVESPGAPPLAWSGGALTKAVADFITQHHI